MRTSRVFACKQGRQDLARLVAASAPDSTLIADATIARIVVPPARACASSTASGVGVRARRSKRAGPRDGRLGPVFGDAHQGRASARRIAVGESESLGEILRAGRSAAETTS